MLTPPPRCHIDMVADKPRRMYVVYLCADTFVHMAARHRVQPHKSPDCYCCTHCCCTSPVDFSDDDPYFSGGDKNPLTHTQQIRTLWSENREVEKSTNPWISPPALLPLPFACRRLSPSHTKHPEKSNPFSLSNCFRLELGTFYFFYFFLFFFLAQCLADIKVTPNGRFYPGTHERVVLVVGEPGSVQMACDRIVTTIYTAADTSLDITQRVLIPDAASGLIIGHDGVRLGDLRQEAGIASIQVY